MNRLALSLGAILIALAPMLAKGQNIVTVPGLSQNGTPPSGFQTQGYKLDCNNATALSGQCWPFMTIWDGTNIAPVVPLGTTTEQFSIPTTPPLTTRSQDPCYLQKKTTITLTSNATSATQVIPLASLNTTYICSVLIVATTATVFNLIEGVGTNCAGSSPMPQVIVGSLTPSSGLSLPAGVPIQLAPGGTVWAMHTSGDEVCFTQTVAENLSMTFSYVNTQL